MTVSGKRLTNVIPMIESCPVCGRQPDIDECGPQTQSEGDLGYYACCYAQTPEEHHVGINADSRILAVVAWNAIAKHIREAKEAAALRAPSHKGSSND